MEKVSTVDQDHTYLVGATVNNCFYVKAKSAEEAEQKVRDLPDHKFLEDSSCSIHYCDKLEPKEDPFRDPWGSVKDEEEIRQVSPDDMR